jgi:hypothetical protein
MFEELNQIVELAVDIPTELSSACFEYRKYSDRTVDVLDIRFLDDDFLCFETELPYL